MSFESIYRMSVVMSMIDNMSAPMRNTENQTRDTVSRLESLSKTFGSMTQLGSVTTALGREITEGVLSPVTATWETKRAIGELASLGVEDLQKIEKASEAFSNQWAGTTKADFIAAAYDIKSGIASLTDEGVAEYTGLAGLTASTTKASVSEMTSLFATGYGIYKNYYSELSDLEFGQIFSAGISDSVRQYKTTGADMAAAIQNLGASATSANVPMEEQLSILGMLQTTMTGAEAGTKYKAFLRSAAKGGEELGLSFLDVNNNLKSLPEILGQLQAKFGDTMDAAEKMELQKAFGDTEAVQMIDLLYSRSGELQSNIISLYGSMQDGTGVAESMAEAINNTDPSKYEILRQKLHNVSETIGNTIQPTVDKYLGKASELVDKAGEWIENHQTLVGWLIRITAVIGITVMVCGGLLAVFGGIGLIFTKTGTLILLFKGRLGLLPGLFEILQIKALIAGDAVHIAMLKVKAGGMAVKGFALHIASMGKQAVTAAATAMPGLIASIWSFTAALLSNPITWIVVGIIALIAALIALYLNWDKVVSFATDTFNGFVDGVTGGIQWVADRFAALPEGLQYVIAALFPFIGIPLLIYNNWGSISDFFTGLWDDAHTAFSNGIQRIKDFMDGLPEWFRASGRKIMETFTSGIQSVLASPAEAVKGGLQKVRNLLPFSDAKEGPLSTLTLSGQRLLETISTGVDMSAGLPAERVSAAFDNIELSGQSMKKVKWPGADREEETSAGGGNAKGIIIQKLVLNTDLKNLEDLRKLKKLLSELEDYINSSGDGDEEELSPEPA